MLAIDNALISDAVVEAVFVCDLIKCKGGCCVDGDAGAPLENDELPMLEESLEAAKQYLTPEHIKEIERQGKFVHDDEFGWVTPAINGGVCVYAFTDEKGIVKCSFEKAYNEGKIAWKKPISCHLFPIRIQKSKDGSLDYVNYEPRKKLCAPACKLGEKLQVPVYQFLKEPIIRKYGQEFFNALQAYAKR